MRTLVVYLVEDLTCVLFFSYVGFELKGLECGKDFVQI
jgi:hypothetical protein